MKEIGVNPGHFPYPLTEGAFETRYMTWLRNHSNFMAERGFLDYMRIAAILIRGILLNFFTLLPYIMLASVAFAWVYAPLLNDWKRLEEPFLTAEAVTPSWVTWCQDVLGTTPPYLFTPVVVMLSLIYLLTFPMVNVLFKVTTHKKSLETGSFSSVKLRDKYERSFSAVLLAIIGLALAESMPLVLHYFHQAGGTGAGGSRERMAMVACGSAVLSLSSAGKVLSLLGELTKPLAMAVLSLLGLMLPLVAWLYYTEALTYPEEAFPLTWEALLIIPAVCAVGISLAIILGLAKKALTHRGWLFRQLAGFLLVGGAIFGLSQLVPEPSLWLLVPLLALEMWAFFWFTVDVNLTSVHPLYRDRLASAYLVGEDTAGDVDIEEDVDLHDLCQHKNGSTAPYHLVNVALNLQNSRDIGIRDRNSDFFIFSKLFVGGSRTGYCRSETLEAVFPQMDLATAMAISAAAASPNMGKSTSRPLVAILTLFNVRLGFWCPNPGRLEVEWAKRILALKAERRDEELDQLVKRFESDRADVVRSLEDVVRKAETQDRPGFTFGGVVFTEEMREIEYRWRQVYLEGTQRRLADREHPTVVNGLAGLAFSGGGIRSATFHLGLVQALFARGVFDHADYLSTVSGGGYLGSSISTLMRRKTFFSPFDGTVALGETSRGEQPVTVTGSEGQGVREFRVPHTMRLEVEDGQKVKQGDSLVERHTPALYLATLMDRAKWRVRPGSFLREMGSLLDEEHSLVNLSDGGHLENLATVELLRRRCKYIITGDGEADPKLTFNGLATLKRFARIDLGIEIEIAVDELRLGEHNRSTGHFAIGRIRYPKYHPDDKVEYGYLLYLKSSFTGDEDELIQEYRATSPDFPHESTADQFFDEGQFEAYRALGQHIAEGALAYCEAKKMSYSDLEDWFGALWEKKGKKAS